MKINSKTRVILIIPFAFLFVTVHAQNRIELDLQTLLKLARVNNPTMQLIQLKEEKVQAELKNEKNWWLPHLRIGVDAHQLWGNTVNSDGRIFTDVDKQSFGAAIGINTYIDLNNGVKNKKLKEYELRSRSFLGQIEKNNYVLELISVYYNLISAVEEKKAYQFLITQSSDIIEQLDVLVKEGLQYNTDLLLAKSNLENHRYNYYEATMEALSLQSSLLKLLFKADNTDIVLSDSLMIPIDLVSDIDMDEAQELSHPYYKHAENQLLAKTFEHRSIKNSILLPRLNFSAYSGTFGDLIFNQAPTQVINGGVSWEIPLSRLSGAEIKALNIEKTILNYQLEMTYNDLRNNVSRLHEQIRLNTKQVESTKKAVGFSSEALEESIERQKFGLARPFEIEQTQEAYINAKMNYFKAIVHYNITQYELYIELGNNM